MIFKDGQQLAGIYFQEGRNIKIGINCDSIIVSMENGQMGRVPWFEVWKEGKIISKWNAAKCEGVLLVQEKSNG